MVRRAHVFSLCVCYCKSALHAARLGQGFDLEGKGLGQETRCVLEGARSSERVPFFPLFRFGFWVPLLK